MNVLSVPADNNMNSTIYEAMEALCIEAVELSPVGKALDEERNELLKAIYLWPMLVSMATKCSSSAWLSVATRIDF